jgi:hypothetical protein
VRIPALVSVRYCAIEKVCMCSGPRSAKGLQLRQNGPMRD